MPKLPRASSSAESNAGAPIRPDGGVFCTDFQSCLQRRSLSALQVDNDCGTHSAAQGSQVCHCGEAEGRRGALSAKREEVPLGCNLGEAVAISSIVSHDSTGCCEITASLLGPCNDKSDGLSHRICTAKNLRLPLQRAYCPFPERSFSLRACFRCSFLSLLFRFRMAARSGGTIRSGNAAPQRIKSNIKHIPVRSLKGAIPADSG